jgi:hypothetical protein
MPFPAPEAQRRKYTLWAGHARTYVWRPPTSYRCRVKPEKSIRSITVGRPARLHSVRMTRRVYRGITELWWRSPATLKASEQRSSWQKSDVPHAFCMKHLETFYRLRRQSGQRAAWACKPQTNWSRLL